MNEDRVPLKEPLGTGARVQSALRQGGVHLLTVRIVRRAVCAVERFITTARIGLERWAFVVASRIRGIPSVRVIGDSHTQLLKGVFPFVVEHIGPATAHNLISPSSSTKSWENLERALRKADPSRDVVLLVFGEIDCRIHVFLQHVRSRRERTTETIVRDTIDRYGQAIERIESLGYRVTVQSVVGAAHQDNIYDYPHYADLRTRGRIASEFNSVLKQWCLEHGIDYLDVFSAVADNDGILLASMTTDGTHLDERALPLYRDWFQAVMCGPSSVSSTRILR